MKFAAKPVAVLDANVLYPLLLRDFFLTLAEFKRFQPKWNLKIQQEWTSNLLKNNTSISRAKLQRTQAQMALAFPDSEVSNYQTIENDLKLPDPDDRHVLAAAIKAKADLIVTFNLKDFPIDYLKNFNLKPIHPDDFAVQLISHNKKASENAFSEQVKRLRNPPLSREEILENLSILGMEKSTVLLSEK